MLPSVRSRAHSVVPGGPAPWFPGERGLSVAAAMNLELLSFQCCVTVLVTVSTQCYVSFPLSPSSLKKLAFGYFPPTPSAVL